MINRIYKMKKYYLSASFILINIVVAFAQQRPQYTQYMINPFLVNPAVSGTEDYTDIRAGYRKQWAGFDGSPRTMYLSAHTNIGKSKVVNNRTKHKKTGFHGVGVVINNDLIGPTSTLTASGAYSYHLALSKKVFASLGIMAGLQQYSLDATQLTTTNSGDASLNGFSSHSLADINLGGWIYSDKFYAGASIIQVAPQKLYNSTTNAIDKGRTAHQYIVMAGYRIPLGYDFTFIPSVCLKAVSPAPVSMDINSKVRYKNLGWLGVSYRHKDAVAFMAGVIINNTFDVSYSYDVTTTHLSKYNSGSHEIIMGYRLRTKKQIICPSSFW
jgi:type IX secretion system PorP/SprF family membrane protein